MFLLHLICAANEAPTDLVETVIEANRDALFKRSATGGLTPLMIACGQGSSTAVIRLLCQHDPNGLKATDLAGYAPIHWACRQGVSHEVIKQILRIDPSQSSRKVERFPFDVSDVSTRDGITPLEILHQASEASARDPSRDWEINQWFKATYILWARHYGSITARSCHSFSTLHAALACSKCPLSIIQRAMKQYGEEMAGVKDVYGNLPLHYAIRSNSVTGADIRQLLAAFPHAAGLVDSKGFLPLHLAVVSDRRSWHEGANEIYQHFPAAAAMRCQATEHALPPALLAALHVDITTTFELLRAFPEIVQQKAS